MEKFENFEKYLTPPSIKNICALIYHAVKTNDISLLEYKNIVDFKYNKKLPFDNDEFKDVLEFTYKTWWNNYLLPKSGQLKTKSIYDEFLNNPKYIPNSKERIGIKRIPCSLENASLLYYKLPFYFQSIYFCIFDTFYLFENDPKFFYNRSITKRLYLETNLKYTPALCKEFLEYILKNNLQIRFKIALTKRKESFVFYTSDASFFDTLNMLEFVKNKRPELFENSKITNPLLAKYKNYIGYGEEPMIFGSYNSVRVDILKETYKNILKEYKIDKKYLTQSNIEKKFESACENHSIDSKKFYKNVYKKLYEEVL